MLDDFKDFYPDFINERIEEVLERTSTLQAFGLDPDRSDPPPSPPKPSANGTLLITDPLDLPTGGVGYHFQRTGIDCLVASHRSNPAKHAVWRAQDMYERVHRARYATRDGFERLDMAQEELDRVIAKYQPIVDEYDTFREAHARATGELYRGLSLAMWAVGKKEGKQGETYQGFLRDLIFIRQPYAEESRIKEYLDLYIYEMDLGDGMGPQPPQGMEPIFSSSLATSYLSDSTAVVDLPSYARAQEKVAVDDSGSEDEVEPSVISSIVRHGGGDSETIKADVVVGEALATGLKGLKVAVAGGAEAKAEGSGSQGSAKVAIVQG